VGFELAFEDDELQIARDISLCGGLYYSGNVVGHMNEVTLRPARLVLLRWVTVRSYIPYNSLCDQPPRPTLFLLSAGRDMSTEMEIALRPGK